MRLPSPNSLSEDLGLTMVRVIAPVALRQSSGNIIPGPYLELFSNGRRYFLLRTCAAFSSSAIHPRFTMTVLGPVPRSWEPGRWSREARPHGWQVWAHHESLGVAQLQCGLWLPHFSRRSRHHWGLLFFFPGYIFPCQNYPAPVPGVRRP